MPTKTRRTDQHVGVRVANWINPGHTITRGLNITTPYKRTFLTSEEARDLADRLTRIADRLDAKNDFNPNPEEL